MAGGLCYVALGDSAAQGVGAASPAASYVSVIADRLRAATGREVDVVNLSASGAKVADVVREQLPRLAALVPEVVTVTAGGNDVRGLDLDRFGGDVARLLDGLPPRTVLADVPFFGGGRSEQRALAAARLLRAAAEARGMVVAPLHGRMSARGWRGMLIGYAADRFHPNDRGYRIWADALWDAATADPGFLARLRG